MQNYRTVYDKAIQWVHENTINNSGITLTSKKKVIYPEVTGYYIPTLLSCGEIELAKSYAKYLSSIQKEDGSWYDSYDEAPYIFDTAQILKGLLSIRSILPEVDENILQGVNWILSRMQSDGRLITPSKNAWGNDESFCCEIIHLYCLSPIKEAGVVFNRPQYVVAVKKIQKYYIDFYAEKIMNFDLLSHFHAYVMEALYDLGEINLCREAMLRFEKHCNPKKAILGQKKYPWVCSTGCFQAALVWYKLGEKEKGDIQFDYACKLQNESGGWYGSYPSSKLLNKLYPDGKRPGYFPNEEISWAAKYFIDAYIKRRTLI